MSLRYLIGTVICIFSCELAHPAPTCEVIDSFRDFMVLSERTAALPEAQQIEAFNLDYRTQYADLYVQSVIMGPGPQLDAKALATMRQARMHPEWREAEQALSRAVPEYAKRFITVFPDFRCNFPINLTATFGVLDGAGRMVGGRPSMVIGVDTVSLEPIVQLPIFFTHELFHRYHYQAAGFSDDLSEKAAIWTALWAEGLATYVSAKLNPANSLADVLVLPRDLEARSRPVLPKMAAELAEALDRVDAKIYGKFFQYGDQEAERAGWPSRSGYYIGYLVAQDLGRRHTLAELAHLKGPALRAEIAEALGRLVIGPSASSSAR
jgi:hypothetical protein